MAVDKSSQQESTPRTLAEAHEVLAGVRSMNSKHVESSLKVSDESHTGMGPFIPFCLTQGCQ
jgi:hypothetical protein